MNEYTNAEITSALFEFTNNDDIRKGKMCNKLFNQKKNSGYNNLKQHWSKHDCIKAMDVYYKDKQLLMAY